MAARTLKRPLGDTSLERKVRWMFGVTLALLLSGSFWWYRSQTDKLIYKGNAITGRVLVGSAITELHAKLFTGAQDDPNAKEAQEWLVENLRSKNFSYYVILPENPQGIDPPQNELEYELRDRWAAMSQQPDFSTDEAIQHFEENDLKPEGRSIRRDVAEEIANVAEKHDTLNGGDGQGVGKQGNESSGQFYQYYQPVFAKSGCIDCHRGVGKLPRDDIQIGDLLAVVRIEVDETPIVMAQRANRGLLITVAIVTGFLTMLASGAIVRKFFIKPLTHLCGVANAVREGNVDQRADISTGDEFQELAVAFNRMVRQLLSQQTQLRNSYDTLDLKVDELAQANLQLFEMNKLKSDFLSTVSHELRTPLNSILGFSEVLSAVDSLDDKQLRYANNIQKSGRMLLDMINDILDLAKIESGKMGVKPIDFRIEAVVLDLCEMAKPLAEKRNVHLACQCQPGLPMLHQDQFKIQQILNNLLSNAIKFTPEGGRITVSTMRDDLGDLRITVEDTGVGISEQEQTLVFEKFRQGTNVLPDGNAMTREYSGTGLGLSIVKELCILLGGEVSLESELGQGSTFRVRLPWKLTEELKLGADLAEELEGLTRKQLALGQHSITD